MEIASPPLLNQTLFEELLTFLECKPHTVLSIKSFFLQILTNHFSSNHRLFHDFMINLHEKQQKSIFFVRHGQSEYNHWREQSCCNLPIFYLNKSTNYDPKLTEKGHKQAEKASETLISLLNEHKITIDTVFVSPLTRALETFIHLEENLTQKNKELRVFAMDLIRERMDFPCDIGSKKEKIIEEFGKKVDFRYLSQENWWRLREKSEKEGFIHEKNISENKENVFFRVFLFILTVLLDEKANNILMVSHQNVFQCLFRRFRVFGGKIRNCECRRLEKEELGKFIEKSLNLI